MDLQSLGDKAVTSGNACPPDNFRAYSVRTADLSRPQPDIPIDLRRLGGRTWQSGSPADPLPGRPQTILLPDGQGQGSGHDLCRWPSDSHVTRLPSRPGSSLRSAVAVDVGSVVDA